MGSAGPAPLSPHQPGAGVRPTARPTSTAQEPQTSKDTRARSSRAVSTQKANPKPSFFTRKLAKHTGGRGSGCWGREALPVWFQHLAGRVHVPEGQSPDAHQGRVYKCGGRAPAKLLSGTQHLVATQQPSPESAREHEHGHRGGADQERARENPKQALHCQHQAHCGAGTHTL